MEAKPKEKKTVKLQFELGKVDDIKVRLAKDWSKNAKRLEAKVKAHLPKGACVSWTIYFLFNLLKKDLKKRGRAT